jgi:hypothetical protein
MSRWNLKILSVFGEDEVFSLDEVRTIAAAIRDYSSSRKLNFDQMHFDF